MSQRSTKWYYGCLILFLLPFALIGLGAAAMIGSHLWSCFAAQWWDERPCEVVSVELKRGSGKGGPTHEVVAEYRYEVNQQPHTGTRVWFGSGRDNIGGFQKRAYDELSDHQRRGIPFRCFVDPKHPDSAVLYRNVRFEMVIFASVFALSFGGIGLGGLIGMVYASPKITRMNHARELHPNEPWKWDDSTCDGTYKASPTWIGAVFGAALVGAISVVMSWGVLENLNRGPNLGWILLLFPAVGAYLAWHAFWAVRKRIRYGVPVLSVRPQPLFVGQPLEVSIEFPTERPSTPELNIELVVSKRVRGRNPDTELHRESCRVANTITRTSATFSPPDSLPRTARLNDENAETAEWRIRVTDTNARPDFEASFDLVVYDWPKPDS